MNKLEAMMQALMQNIEKRFQDQGLEMQRIKQDISQ